MIALDIESGSGSRRVDLLDYLEPSQEERAHVDAHAWIKAVRHARVDGRPVRNRFTFRGDSLWWFAELYLHKEHAALNVLRILSAFDGLVERERPLAVTHVSGGYPGVIAHAAAARKVRYEGQGWPSTAGWLTRMNARGLSLAVAARASRLRQPPAPPGRAPVAAFVHRAFWHSGVGDGGAESYIGPVLKTLESRIGTDGVRYVGIGPRSNFRARRWWQAALPSSMPPGIVAIEQYAPAGAMAPSRAIFKTRHEIRRALWASPDLRAHAVIRGCDCWPLMREQLAGIALLQFPWSARAMDEAAAALRAIEPDVAVTYAEAGGWGRALALECRRMDVPLAGLQHGFIYRHWLNYRHEPDEILPDPDNREDRGFPFPASTLLFDDDARRHLTTAGGFPPSAVQVTGSARLDELVTAVRALDARTIGATRADAGASDARPLVLFAAKEREARRSLPALIAAMREMPEVQLAIKPHPAETPDVYRDVVGDIGNVRILATSAPMPPLLAAARAIVTVNSTVAIDAMSLGVPSIVIGLPNNLTPFVESGVMTGATSAAEIRAALGRVLYDQEFRTTTELEMAARAAAAGGSSAARAADAILRLAKAN